MRTKHYLSGAHTIVGIPSVCARCREPNSAEGYYESKPAAGLPTVRIGICRRHKAHGGAKIFWQNEGKKQ